MYSDILLAVYGSEMVNALFMLPKSAVIEIDPPFWEDDQYKQYVTSLGLNHFLLPTTGPLSKVCQKRPDSLHKRNSRSKSNGIYPRYHDLVVEGKNSRFRTEVFHEVVIVTFLVCCANSALRHFLVNPVSVRI